MTPNQSSDIRIHRKRRWRRLGLWLFLLAVPGLVGDLGWGAFQQRKLTQTVDRLQKAGEPIFPRDFDEPSVPDADNAAVELGTVAANIHDSHFSDLLSLPLQGRSVSVAARLKIADSLPPGALIVLEAWSVLQRHRR